MRAIRPLGITALGVALALGVSGCAPGAGDDDTITVMYQRTEAFTALDDLLQRAVPVFEQANEGVRVELQPIEGNDEDYKTRLALAQRSADTAPDVFYEDTYNVRADVEAGYLLNLDDYLADWSEWDQFTSAAKAAGDGGDGTYAVPLGVDTRVIWYSKPLLEAAGVAIPWQPTDWDDLIEVAAAVESTSPGTIPFNMYIGRGMGEAATTSSLMMLLYGTGSSLYDGAEQRWVTGSQGLVDSLAFLQDLYADGYSGPVDESLDGNIWQVRLGEELPAGELAAVVDGSYLPSFWQEGGSFPWPEYEEDMGVALFPTQDGGGDGFVSVSGGWSLALGAQSDAPDLAFEFLTTALSFDNLLDYTIQNSQIAVRQDVADDPGYLSANPFVAAVTDAVQYTVFRPGTSDYPTLSLALQDAMEAVVVDGVSPEEAAAAYDEAVIQAVGEDNTVAG